MSASWTLRLLGVPPSLNETYHLHWSKVTKIGERWKSAVWWRCKEQRIPALGRAKVTITRHNRSTRLLDHANFVGSIGCKAALDALVEVGVIEDDDPGHLLCTYQQGVCAKGEAPWTEIRIEAWDGQKEETA